MEPSIGDLLGIEPESVRGLGLYSVGTEPVSTPPPRPRRRARRVARRGLDGFLRDAEAGASDPEIARLACCTTAQVRRWRLSHDIVRPRGRPSTHSRATLAATALFGRPFDPVVCATESAVDGCWEPPEYLVREALDYGVFVRCVVALVDTGFCIADLVRGLGVRAQDIEHAVVLGDQDRC